jgi:glycosyltransferase involved in cell wall biosynthesis
MAIYYDIAAAVHGRAGLGRYAESLARALFAEHGDHLVLFYNADADTHPLAGLETVPQRTIRAGYRRWRMQIWLGQLLRMRFNHLLPGAELYHATEHLLMPLSGIPTVLTIHDLIYRLFPRYHKLLNYVYLNLAVPLFCRRATAIIAVSQATRRDLVMHYHIDPAKITVIHEAAAPGFAPQHSATISAVRTRYHLPQRYLLTECVIEPRKNHSRFLRVFEKLSREESDLYWVIVGAKGWLYEPFFQQLERSPARQRVILPGYIDDSDLAAVFSGALAFVFPSLYEGFGLPPLEAMACGTPVVCSDASSLPEVGGTAAQYFDPYDEAHMLDVTHRVLADPELRVDMGRRGLAQAAEFSWQRAARETWALYQRLVYPRQDMPSSDLSP